MISCSVHKLASGLGYLFLFGETLGHSSLKVEHVAGETGNIG